ncbi:hypothetical protein WISP_94991 [Willisornis vidua]|uniref:Uncharacterized protein n=1 Tax=Willisornis vidua TaxID=1566151 RepID=A0ABQ9D683_9PASS|nr:hypothetical protein WISP_94991 [Willisornis vidua]
MQTCPAPALTYIPGEVVRSRVHSGAMNIIGKELNTNAETYLVVYRDPVLLVSNGLNAVLDKKLSQRMEEIGQLGEIGGKAVRQQSQSGAVVRGLQPVPGTDRVASCTNQHLCFPTSWRNISQIPYVTLEFFLGEKGEEKGMSETNQRPALGNPKGRNSMWEYRGYEDVCSGAHLPEGIRIAGKPKGNAWEPITALSAIVFKTAQQDPMKQTSDSQMPLHLRASGIGHGPMCCLSEHVSPCWQSTKVLMLAA